MKLIKLLFLLLCWCFSFAANAKTDNNTTEEYICEEREEKLYCLDEKGAPLSGKRNTFYTNNKPKSIENFKKGYPDSGSLWKNQSRMLLKISNQT